MVFLSVLFCALVGCVPTNPPLVIETPLPASPYLRSSRDLFSQDPLIVRTDKGFIQGDFQKTLDGRQISAFQSIPYAKSPTGERRFRAPVPVDPWTGIIPTNSPAPFCLQLDFSRTYIVHGKEDCLYLNVYSPQVIGNKSYPVIIFVHGGGNMCGSSNQYGPAYFLNHDIVLVTINYRLGPLGFLSTGDSAASGNWGMKDIILALRWVQTNIKSFGGDPSRVTVMGESTGAAAVGLLVVSPEADGLIHRVICQSGSALSPYGLLNDTLKNSKILANDLNCPTQDSRAMMKCMRARDPNWVVSRSINSFKELLIKPTFGPVIEHKELMAKGDKPFVVESPEVSYAQGRAKPVPMIIGMNKDEGAFFSAIYYLIPLTLSKLNRRWNDLAPFALAYESRAVNQDEVSDKIRKFYMKDGERMTFWNRQSWMRAFGDRAIVQSVFYGMQHHSLIAPTYGYVFSYGNKMSVFNSMGLNGRDWGVGHVDELLYFFNNSFFDPVSRRSQGDYRMSSFLTDVWSTFAATGKPDFLSNDSYNKRTEFWKPITDWRNMMVVNISTTLEMIPVPFKDRMEFWENLKLKDDYPVVCPNHKSC